MPPIDRTPNAGALGLVRVSQTDTVARYLFSKLAAGMGISFLITDPGDDEVIQISNSDKGSDALSAHLTAFDHAAITHTNRSVLDGTQESFTTANKNLYDSYAQACILIDIGDGINTILNGTTGYSAPLPWSGTIIGWDIVENSAVPTDSSIEVELWKDTAANYPPTAADKITAAAPMSLVAAKIIRSTTLTGWNTSLVAGECIGFTVISVAVAKRIQISIRVSRTS